MLVVFDLDGVVLDSRDVVLAAYREAGATPPEDVLALEGVPWLLRQCGSRAPDVYARKNSAYIRMLYEGHAQLLPPYRVAHRLRSQSHRVGVLTAAPHGTIDALRTRYDDWPFDWWGEALRTPAKMKILERNRGGVYIDDQDRLVNVPSGWRFIRYDGQDEETLYEEVMYT